ncbi:hypothetical protein [Nonlabens xiamenensis]|uniref:hypothetical protein n=1 Tax=Nonlabens xiamenensis TaxID=2341043 RepID=UPI000F614896|nr:hypothetical protein [Nonlabens xiamenensis]
MANLEWQPINPLLKEDGSFYSLSLEDNAHELKPLQLEEGDNPFSQFKVMQKTLNIQTAAKLGIALGSVNGSFKSFVLSYEAMLYTDKITSTPIGGKIYGTRWGAGLRVLLKVSEIKSNADFKFGAIAAAAELGLAKVEYEINGIGISKPSILKSLPGPAEFNFDSYNKILEAAEKVRRYMADNHEELKPEPFQVYVSDEINNDIYRDARSVIVAARNIISRNSLQEAISNAAGKYNIDIITGFYLKMGIANENERPSRDDKRAAIDFLDD